MSALVHPGEFVMRRDAMSGGLVCDLPTVDYLPYPHRPPRNRWRQPPTCTHGRERVSDQRMCDLDERWICANCGEEIISDEGDAS